MMNVEFVEFRDINEFEEKRIEEQRKELMCDYENVRLDENGYFGDAQLMNNHQNKKNQQEKNVDCGTNMNFEEFVF